MICVTRYTTMLALAFSGALHAMPAEQQNALVRKYCAGCHTDKLPQGGLTLEHFDASNVAPSLAAMMLSKITGGVALRAVGSADSSPLLRRKMKTGAMGASGIAWPDETTILSLMQALYVQATGWGEWRAEQPPISSTTVLASTAQEKVWSNAANDAMLYRLRLSCDTATAVGSMQLTWAPGPERGTVTVFVDGNQAGRYAESHSGPRDLASIVLSGDQGEAGIALPAKTLRISNLFTGGDVVFSFASLAPETRHQLGACFQKAIAANP